jgi:hypothetical protein
MGTRETRALAAELEGVRRRFEHWRRTRKIPSRIPGPLWAAAVKVASACGISHTAKTLRVNHHALKKQITEAAATSGGPDRGGVAAFLELGPPTQVGRCQCTLELEDACGAKMRVHLQSVEAPDLASLSRSFWELRS